MQQVLFTESYKLAGAQKYISNNCETCPWKKIYLTFVLRPNILFKKYLPTNYSLTTPI